ncbi:MAG: transketolase C-terminal domain-containing protein [Candidatus Norongarragalinales archaeon]
MQLNEKLFLAGNLDKPEKIATRDGLGKALVEAGEKNESLVVLSADLAESTRAQWFGDKFPERFFQCGVAEQNMMAVAAGLGLDGKTAVATSFSVFSPGRNWDQVRISVCYNESNVKICSTHSGITVGGDGATHEALEDIASTRVLPKMRVLVPCDFWEAKKATLAAIAAPGPFYVRYGREKMPVITTEQTPFEIGKAYVFKEGSDVAIIANGFMVFEALVAAKELEETGVSAAVVNLPTVKPIDSKMLEQIARKCGAVVSAEDHQIHGGVGSAIAESLAKTYPVPQEFVGMQDCFGESGTAQELMKKYGMTRVEIKAAAKKVLKRK